ncbi:MAG: LptA/OstA family protein [Candidatus Omnitrophota bacterium]|nr:LptA/OstA family protein [Candidatus Omnitrophota bacterium]
MMRVFLFAVLILLLTTILAFSQEKVTPVEINGDEISYLQEQGSVVVKRNVILKYQDMVITSDEAEYNANTHISHIKGNVKIVRQGTTVYGQDIIYDFNTQNAQIVDMRMESPPLYGKAKEADRQGPDKYVLKDSYVTTCNLEKPHYRLTAKQIIAYPRVKVIAKNMIMKVGEIPVFYFPYYSHSLKDKSFPLEIYPGSKGDWGQYFLSRYRYHINDEQRGRIIFDWYEDRGFGKGIEHKMESKKYGQGLLNYYQLEDKLYKPENRDKLFNKYPERRTIDPKYLEDDRYKAQFFQAWKPIQNLSIKSEFNKFSDEFFMKDFFQQEYDIQPHPLSYNLIDYSFPGSSLSLLTQARANKFFSETQYLPQLRYDFYNQNLGQSGIYLQSTNTAGYLEYKYAYSGLDYDSGRTFTHNVFNYPKTLGWLYINPYVGNYSAFYSKNIFGNEDIWRVAFQSGIDMSTKLYKTYDIDLALLGTKIEKMHHVITPRINYGYLHPPTTPNSDLVQFDEIDNLTRSETVTFALDNKLQARNKEKTWDFVYFSPSIVYQVNKKDKLGILDRKGTYLSAIKSDLEIYPIEGISFNSDAEYDCAIDAFKSANLDMTVSDTKNKKYTVSFGQRYARIYDYNSDLGEYSSQSTFDLTYQLTSKLQFKNYLRYEFKEGLLEEQQYALRIDLHCWWLDVGVDIDKQRRDIGIEQSRVTDTTLWFAFVLKEFPDISIGFDQTYSGAKSSY